MSEHEYSVYAMAIYYDTVIAESPEEAAEKIRGSCPYDIDGSFPITVINEDTGEECDV